MRMSLLRRALLGAALLLIAAPALFAQMRPRYVPITLLHTNDLHGRVHLPGEPQGLAKIATLVRRIRREMPNVLLLDAGDIIHGTPEEKIFRGRPILSAMNALGYDAAAAGNHEFDAGQDVLRDALRFVRFPLLSANVRDARTGAPWDRLMPYVVRERDGVRVAVFGLTTPTTVRIEWPRTLAGIRFDDPIETARALVPRLRNEERADIVVALTHLGVIPDGLLAATVPGIDIILGGHSHTTLAEQVWVGETLILQTGAHARNLGRVDLVVRKGADGKSRTALVNGKNGRWWGHDGVRAPRAGTFPKGSLIPITPDIPDDPDVVAAYRPFADAVRPVLDEVLTTAAEPLPAADATMRETAVGNLLADAVRAQTNTDVGVAASSQIAPSGLPAGPVRVRDLYALLGAYTRQHLVIARVSGARLRAMITRVTEGGRFPVHVSGLGAAADGVITVADRPLDDAKTYTIAGAAHVIQDYLLGKEDVAILQDDPLDPTVRDAAIAYLRGRAPLRSVVENRLATPRLPASRP